MFPWNREYKTVDTRIDTKIAEAVDMSSGIWVSQIDLMVAGADPINPMVAVVDSPCNSNNYPVKTRIETMALVAIHLMCLHFFSLSFEL